ncbi:hypothetical protein BaRGS_00023541 [Batillaria attramentaria]|uniref:Uncharacterized protein n=1 Tax=Batillaria attramentaria TaxID=370345 RepID=A0ABD0KDS5_9CAEN
MTPHYLHHRRRQQFELPERRTKSVARTESKRRKTYDSVSSLWVAGNRHKSVARVSPQEENTACRNTVLNRISPLLFQNRICRDCWEKHMRQRPYADRC